MNMYENFVIKNNKKLIFTVNKNLNQKIYYEQKNIFFMGTDKAIIEFYSDNYFYRHEKYGENQLPIDTIYNKKIFPNN
ncbi:MAG: hypothetical protein RSE41_10200 [Clostridia bacterium]